MIRKGVSAIILNKKDELLLVNLESFETKYFAVLGGGVEGGETLEDAVYREIEEEVGITKEFLQKVGQSKNSLIFKFKTPKINKEGKEYHGSERYFFGFYFTGDDTKLCPREGEVRTCKWVSFDNLKDFLLFDNQLGETVEKVLEIFPNLNNK